MNTILKEYVTGNNELDNLINELAMKSGASETEYLLRPIRRPGWLHHNYRPGPGFPGLN